MFHATSLAAAARTFSIILWSQIHAWFMQLTYLENLTSVRWTIRLYQTYLICTFIFYTDFYQNEKFKDEWRKCGSKNQDGSTHINTPCSYCLLYPLWVRTGSAHHNSGITLPNPMLGNSDRLHYKHIITGKSSIKERGSAYATLNLKYSYVTEIFKTCIIRLWNSLQVL